MNNTNIFPIIRKCTNEYKYILMLNLLIKEWQLTNKIYVSYKLYFHLYPSLIRNGIVNRFNLKIRYDLYIVIMVES